MAVFHQIDRRMRSDKAGAAGQKNMHGVGSKKSERGLTAFKEGSDGLTRVFGR